MWSEFVFGRFIVAVATHWGALMSGGLIMVTLSLYERFSRRDVPFWLYLSVIAFFLFLACYFEWKKERKKRMRAENDLAKLNEHKLIFEVDQRATRVYLKEYPNQYPLLGIVAQIKLRFENKDIHPMSMKRLDLSLHELQPEKPTKDIYTAISFRYSMNGTEIKRDEFEGMMIQGRRLTPFYLVEATMPIDDEAVKSSNDLTSLHFLRLTMDAGGYQATFSGDLFLSWKHALGDKGTDLTVTFNAPAIITDYRRVED